MKKPTKKLSGALLGLILIGIAVPRALTAPTATLTARVLGQQCAGGGLVNVTLTAMVNPPRSGVTYVWDFENDGVFDTEPSSDPTVSHLYPDYTPITARVRVMKGRRSAETTVVFGTPAC